MMLSPSLAEWNHQVLMLMQALAGAVSSNFRMVTLGHDGNRWCLRFFIEEDLPQDREEIEDIVSEFEAFQDQAIAYGFEVYVGTKALPMVQAPERVVFRRRES